MKANISGAVILCVLVTACASPPQKSNIFTQADTNHDGYISMVEWRQAGGNEVAFIAADRDHKNKLSEPEFFEAIRLDEQSKHSSEAQQRDNDIRLTQDVHNALMNSNEVNGGSVVVETNNGTIQLSGTVRTVKEKKQAEVIAQNVRGVRQVFNSITVKN